MNHQNMDDCKFTNVKLYSKLAILQIYDVLDSTYILGVIWSIQQRLFIAHLKLLRKKCEGPSSYNIQFREPSIVQFCCSRHKLHIAFKYLYIGLVARQALLVRIGLLL